MKKYINISTIILVFVILLTGCTGTVTKDEDGNTKREFTINEKAIVNNTEININSIKKINNDCLWEFEGECQSETTPDNDYFLIIDLTIKNSGEDDLSISSLLSFDLKNESGEQGSLNIFSSEISTPLDATVMPNDLLTGQIVYDVKDSDEYYFYYKDSLFDKNIKFIIEKNEIK